MEGGSRRRELGGFKKKKRIEYNNNKTGRSLSLLPFFPFLPFSSSMRCDDVDSAASSSSSGDRDGLGCRCRCRRRR